MTLYLESCTKQITKSAYWNYIDDSGLQVADILVGFMHFKYDQMPPDGKKFDHYCGDDIYVKTTLQYDADPSLESIRRDVLKELEDGASETANLQIELPERFWQASLRPVGIWACFMTA